MDDKLLFFFLENMALIIALMYMALRVKESLSLDKKNPAILFVGYALFINFLTFSVMYHPFFHEGMRIDLREVPLFFISYIGGWKVGILSSILPAIYRIYLGGPTVLEGTLQSIILPVIIGALFHVKKPANPLLVLINLKRMMAGFILFEMIKTVAFLLSTPITPFIAAVMFIFAAIAALSMALMLNEENRKLLLRKELEFLSNQDPMTHLPNIRFFKNRVQKLLMKDEPVSIVMFDVDYFKTYNDTHGHQKGDAVLRTLGQLLKEAAGKNDVIARYGGEEFILCYSGASDEENVKAAAERFRKNVQDYRFEGEEQQPEGDLTISLGVSFSGSGKTLEQIIEEADQALYQSKKMGRNRVTVWVG
ncbi:diguanylate cyclase [Planomicrobium sp. CPCC 101110]|uniref:GGDEF domain-containing protein n=1 Tax=Planomicrobium sp. CPCC 101110 TaxID=2599619 RepID=UPI0011B4FAB2|nr:diguanylate cyclase [Planomicrobium sp. CPCC 101110]TWT24905.1 diguanylate cyclase [Planomicrobium sp. CPCC 101110]